MENEQKKLEILVVEDNLLHQEGARVLLAQHNPQIVGTFDEAADLIIGGSRYSPNKGNKQSYDAVLTDLFIPQGRGDCMADKSMAKQEMPLGYAVAMMALKEGTPYVAMISDANHHANPMAYSLDLFQDKNGDNEVINFDVIGKGCSRLAIIGGITPKNGEIIYRTPNGRIGTREEVGRKTKCTAPGSAFGEDFDDEDPIEPLIEVPEGSQVVKNYKAVLDLLIGE